jgi:hypothetical protein
MRRLATIIVMLGSAAGLTAQDWRAPAGETFTSTFAVDRADFISTGRNPYFILEPGYALILEGGRTRLVVTVLPDTRQVDGVETRVVEERETENGELIEVSRNFFAIHTKTNSVFYFGEDVDMYKNGKVTSHDGAWRSGVAGARFGMMMPGLPLLKARYYQEIAPRVAMDRAEILGIGETLKTPAGTFTDVLRTQETTPLEPLAREAKYYAKDVGLIQDGDLKLVRVGKQD